MGRFTASNKQSKHQAQSRPRPSANCRSDGSVGVFASLASVMSLMRQHLALVKRWDAMCFSCKEERQKEKGGAERK
jgi:hypothetical protein